MSKSNDSARVQCERIISAINNTKPYWNAGNGLEVSELNRTTNTANIMYNGTNVGYVLDDWDRCEFIYIAITLEARAIPARFIKQLTVVANKNMMKVVFVPSVDIGFGLSESPEVSNKMHLKLLKQIAGYSQDTVKTAALTGIGYPIVRSTSARATAYTYNQTLFGYPEKMHAEATLVEFAKLANIPIDQCEYWLMDLEPCEDCLRKMINLGARGIAYYTSHKDKWNTPEYLQLVNDIDSKTIKNPGEYPIIYSKETL